MRNVMRLKHMRLRTEQAYVSWVKRFILFHDKRHPAEMGADESRAFLTHLAVQELLGRKDVSTTMVYTHVLQRGGKGVCSPLDP
jgi:site-specific recombinase XerC